MRERADTIINKSSFFGDIVAKRRFHIGPEQNREVQKGGQRRLELVRGSFRVDQQATLGASESRVPAVNVDGC